MSRAFFITLDGTDGAGKSTQLNYLRDWYAAKRFPVHFTREIGGTPLGEQIRSLILNPENDWDLDSELLMIHAARRQHYVRLIQPLLQQGVSVVCDRFHDATYAYQGARSLHNIQKRIAELEQWTLGDFRPDLSLIFVLDSSEAKRRRAQRRQKMDAMEMQNDAFFQRVENIYRQRSTLEKHIAIDAQLPPKEVFAQIKKHLEALYAA